MRISDGSSNLGHFFYLQMLLRLVAINYRKGFEVCEVIFLKKPKSLFSVLGLCNSVRFYAINIDVVEI